MAKSSIKVSALRKNFCQWPQAPLSLSNFSIFPSRSQPSSHLIYPCISHVYCIPFGFRAESASLIELGPFETAYQISLRRSYPALLASQLDNKLQGKQLRGAVVFFRKDYRKMFVWRFEASLVVNLTERKVFGLRLSGVPKVTRDQVVDQRSS